VFSVLDSDETRHYLLHMMRAFALILALASCTTRPPTFGNWQPTVMATAEIAALERQMFERLNRDRAGRGLAPLSWDARLSDIARAHSQDMRHNRFFAHESPSTGVLEDRMIRAGYLAYEMRENLAVASDVERAENNLLESPGHHANIMATEITTVGIGIVPGGLHGDPRGLTVTQVFARPARVDTPDEAVGGATRRIAGTRAAVGLAALNDHPLLVELARAYVADLDDVSPGRSLANIADAAAKRIGERGGHDLRGIQLVAQVLFEGATIESPSFTSAVRYQGIAAAPARDQRGRPRVKVLVLLGE
jgi:uncharacterized protein YkwD